MGGKTYRFCNLRKWKDFKNNNTKKKKKTAYLTQMCVTSLLCGPWADLLPFHWLYCKRFSLST